MRRRIITVKRFFGGSRTVLAVLVGLILILGAAGTSFANHSWGNYHWARTTSSFTVKLGDNVNSGWDSYLKTASTDWSKSNVLDTVIVAGQSSSRRCPATAGRVEICNDTYGNNGWLGIASISASGGHITQGTVKMNDTYYNTAQYNTPAWRQLVICQEIGHTFGLDHQDETFDNPNLGTCMDYTNNPSTNQHPNQHDYEQLATIYKHLDSTTTISATPAEVTNADMDNPAQWGKLVDRSKDGHLETYERDFGNDHKVITHVFWVEPRGNR
jgi:hypothetical protein